MTLRLRISPCPNDTFMFDALLNGRIDTGGLHFDVEYRDIEELNREAAAGLPDASPPLRTVTRCWTAARRSDAATDRCWCAARGTGRRSAAWPYRESTPRPTH